MNIERIKILFVVLGLYFTYIFVIQGLRELIYYYLNYYEYKKYEANKEKHIILNKEEYERKHNAYIENFKKRLKILIKISKIQNKFTILYHLYNLRMQLYKFFSIMNVKLVNYVGLRKIIYVIIMCIFIYPLHLILGIKIRYKDDEEKKMFYYIIIII